MLPTFGGVCRAGILLSFISVGLHFPEPCSELKIMHTLHSRWLLCRVKCIRILAHLSSASFGVPTKQDYILCIKYYTQKEGIIC